MWSILSADLWQKVGAFLKRAWRYGFTTSIYDVQALLDSSMHDLFVQEAQLSLRNRASALSDEIW